MVKTYFDEKVKASPSKADIGQLQKSQDSQSIVKKEKDAKMGRLGVISTDSKSPSCIIMEADGLEAMCARGRTDDENGECLVSAFLPKRQS